VSESPSNPRPAPAGISRRGLGVAGLALAGLAAKASPSQSAEAPDPAPAAVASPASWQADVLDVLRPYDHPDRPGLSVAVAQGGAPLFRWAGGAADLDHGLSMRPDTHLHVASVSKQFTAFAIALLEADGRLSLTDDIRKHLPEVPDLGAPITLDHLIHHTSGLRDQWSLLELAGIDLRSRITQRQVLNLVARQQGLNFPPGTQFAYCNTGYTLLAEVVRAVSGQTLRAFAEARIFKPLGMTETFVYDDASEIVPRRALSYEPRDGGGWRYVRLNYETWGATSVHTTASDLALWGGNFANPKVGDAALIRRLTTPGRLTDGTSLRYGFGLQTWTRAGHACIFHGGSDAGFRATFAHFPDSDLTVVVLANTPHEVSHLTNQIADIVLNPGSARLGERLRGALSASPAPNAALAGAYADRNGELLRIHAEGPQARLRRAGQAARPLNFRTDGSFDLGQPESLTYRALRDPQGQIVALEESLNAGGPPTRYRRIALPAPHGAELAGLPGRYRSTELDTIYSLTVEDQKLVARTILNGEAIRFQPTLAGHFVSDSDFLSTLVVERGRDGAVDAFVVNSGRMAGIRFKRVPA
jgi:CubicO group peptidase (beta-lactamase class C family)